MANRTVDVPKVLTVPDASNGWRAEGEDVAEGEPSFGSLTLSAKSCALRANIAMELLEDATDPAAIDEALIRALAAEIDRVALYGSGAANQPQGLVGTSGVESAAVTGDVASWAQVLEAIFAVRQRNAYGPVSVLLSERSNYQLRAPSTRPASSSRRPRSSRAARRPSDRRTASPTTAERAPTSPRWSRATSAACTSGSGGLRIQLLKGPNLSNLTQTVVAHLRMDVGVAETDAFAVRTGIAAAAA